MLVNWLYLQGKKSKLFISFYWKAVLWFGQRQLWLKLGCKGVPSDSALKKAPATQDTQETWVRSLGQEDPLEEGRTTHSVFLPEKSHEKRRLMGYSLLGPIESDRTVARENLSSSPGDWQVGLPPWVITFQRCGFQALEKHGSRLWNW